MLLFHDRDVPLNVCFLVSYLKYLSLLMLSYCIGIVSVSYVMRRFRSLSANILYLFVDHCRNIIIFILKYKNSLWWMEKPFKHMDFSLVTLICIYIVLLSMYWDWVKPELCKSVHLKAWCQFKLLF